VELTSKIARKKVNTDMWATIIDKYAQDMSQAPEQIDPTAIQMGQSIYDGTGTEYVVIEDDPTTTDKTVMPADQSGSDLPEGVKTVQDTELSSEFNVQPAEGIVASIEPEFVRG